MFRAKPAMNATVVQLLVDSYQTRQIADQNKWRLFRLIIAFSISDEQVSKQELLLAEGCWPTLNLCSKNIIE